MSFTLYKAAPAWGLPSHSLASIQLEAYLRLSKVNFAAVNNSTPGNSPTGQLPAVEDPQGTVLATGRRAGSENETVLGLIEELKRLGSDLDQRLNANERAQLVAFTALIERQLEPATLWTTWGEQESFTRHTRAAASGDLPFPLSFLVPWLQKRTVLKQLAGKKPSEIYRDAAQCYEALAAQINTANGQYFFGASPSSIDALLYGHIALHLSAPTTAPELQQAVESHAVLKKYAENLAREFSAPLPPTPSRSASPEWTARAQAAASGTKQQQPKKTKAERDHQRRNYIWLGCAAATVIAYVFLSGQVLEFDFIDDDAGVEGEE